MFRSFYKINKLLVYSLWGFFALSCYAQSQAPTKKDIRYSQEFERSILDLWLAESKKPTPLVVNFHGGGFRMGDKGLFNRNPILKNTYRVSFDVNYLVQQVDGNYTKFTLYKSIRFLKRMPKTKYRYQSNFGDGHLITCYLAMPRN